MSKEDFVKTINLIKGYYRITFSDEELELLKDELKDLTYDEFVKEIKDDMLIAIDYFKISELHRILVKDYFKISELHRILVNYKDSILFLKKNNLNSFEELYANYEKFDEEDLEEIEESEDTEDEM